MQLTLTTGQNSNHFLFIYMGIAMLKEEAVASMGESALLMPAWVRAALAANDRLKFFLSVLQAALQHARSPEVPVLDLRREQAAAGVRAPWLTDLIAGAAREGGGYNFPALPRWLKCLRDDLEIMAKPVLASGQDAGFKERLAACLTWLNGLTGDDIADPDLERLQRGERQGSDDNSFHLLVMDLHKALNRLAAGLATGDLDGAHVWNLTPGDEPRVQAFMRGLHRTALLKFDHPGLDTAATRDGEYLVIQNDIGTNDAHVLVLRAQETELTLTYSDLHRRRFDFFKRQLEAVGAVWSVVAPARQDQLNGGKTYWLGTATFTTGPQATLESLLEAVGARIVFLIDWNRARKDLQRLVGKDVAVQVLEDAAQGETGHMAWLKAGGAGMVLQAMRAAGNGIFELGDTLQGVMGVEGARLLLGQSFRLSLEAMRSGSIPELVGDELAMTLARELQHRADGLTLAEEHAAWCLELAQGLRRVLEPGPGEAAEEISALALRAKGWERKADRLVERARDGRRQNAGGLPPFAELTLKADDIADALEEAVFLTGLAHETGCDGFCEGASRKALLALADTVLTAARGYVQAVSLARLLAGAADARDGEAFLDATWAVVMAERTADEQLRAARRTFFAKLHQAGELMLATDIAEAMETASDRLADACFSLRRIVLNRHPSGAPA